MTSSNWNCRMCLFQQMIRAFPSSSYSSLSFFHLPSNLKDSRISYKEGRRFSWVRFSSSLLSFGGDNYVVLWLSWELTTSFMMEMLVVKLVLQSHWEVMVVWREEEPLRSLLCHEGGLQQQTRMWDHVLEVLLANVGECEDVVVHRELALVDDGGRSREGGKQLD